MLNHQKISGGGYSRTEGMNIPEDVRITKYQHIAFAENTKLGELYDALREYWRLDRDNCEVFAASVFYNLGRIHGIRAERARRRAS